jgi:lipopolysaccharide export system permease protein
MAAERTALHRKFAEPAAATAFALFALAIGLYSFRKNLGLGLVSVFLLTFIYYATWSVFNLLGAQGTLPPWLAGWAPVALYAASGGLLLGLVWRR